MVRGQAIKPECMLFICRPEWEKKGGSLPAGSGKVRQEKRENKIHALGRMCKKAYRYRIELLSC